MPTLQYFGDVIEELDGCLDATSGCITAAWKGFSQLLTIITNRDILLRNCGTSSAPVLEISCCMVAKHGQPLAKQFVIKHLLTMVWFTGSVVSDLNTVLELKKSKSIFDCTEFKLGCNT